MPLTFPHSCPFSSNKQLLTLLPPQSSPPHLSRALALPRGCSLPLPPCKPSGKEAAQLATLLAPCHWEKGLPRLSSYCPSSTMPALRIPWSFPATMCFSTAPLLPPGSKTAPPPHRGTGPLAWVKSSLRSGSNKLGTMCWIQTANLFCLIRILFCSSLHTDPPPLNPTLLSQTSVLYFPSPASPVPPEPHVFLSEALD